MHPTLKYVLAAAAAVIVAVGAIRLTPLFTGPGGPFGPSPSPTPGPSLRVWDGQGTLDPGAWAMDVGDVRVNFDIPAVGWQENVVPDVIWHAGSEGRIGFHIVDNLYVDPCDSGAFRDPPIGPSVDDLANALATLPAVQSDASPADVNLGEHGGKLVEINIAAGEEPCGGENAVLWQTPRGEATQLETGARSRIWVIDVDGTRLVVYAVERDSFPTVLRNELQQILDSLRFDPM